VYSKIKIAGHPVHPMLVAFPVASYTGTLAGFAVYAANGHQFWLNLAIALAIVGVCSAVLAALPGLADLAFGVPRGAAHRTGLVHAACNIAALGLFLAVVASYETHWNGPPAGATLGLALSASGVALTAVAGFLGWKLVQDYHVGVRLAPEQERAEPAAEHIQPSATDHRRAA
jgi:uncharacterized membrane protein